MLWMKWSIKLNYIWTCIHSSFHVAGDVTKYYLTDLSAMFSLRMQFPLYIFSQIAACNFESLPKVGLKWSVVFLVVSWSVKDKMSNWLLNISRVKRIPTLIKYIQVIPQITMKNYNFIGNPTIRIYPRWGQIFVSHPRPSVKISPENTKRHGCFDDPFLIPCDINL